MGWQGGDDMRLWTIGLLAMAMGGSAAAAPPVSPIAHHVAYGHDAAAGASFTHGGVRLYYEIHGKGPPLLLIHGNGASIGSMAAQIAHFQAHYRVISMDSRDHGQSGDSPVPLTFEAMADDLAALLTHVGAAKADVVGWSDGAIEALLLAQRHPMQVRRIVAMAGNLDPSGLDPAVLATLAPAGAPVPDKATRAGRVEALDQDEPHIAPASLASITAPTLVMAGDHDVIGDAHTLLIYHSLPNAQLAILPDATHMVPYDDPARFNAVIDRFLSTAFVKRDRIGDLMKSIEKMQAEAKAAR